MVLSFPIEVPTRKLLHKFYLINSPATFIAGFDLVAAAQLINYAVGRTVYTRSPSTNSFVSASLTPIVSASTDIHTIDSSDTPDEPSSSSLPSVTDSLEHADSRCPVIDRRSLVAPLTLCTDDHFVSSVLPLADTAEFDVPSSDLDVPEHLRVLFLTTVEEAHFSSTLAYYFKHDTFAKSPTDNGFCDLLEHDIDTCEAPPIRKPPRRPPLAPGKAEDDLMTKMLAADVIEPTDSP